MLSFLLAICEPRRYAIPLEKLCRIELTWRIKNLSLQDSSINYNIPKHSCETIRSGFAYCFKGIL